MPNYDYFCDKCHYINEYNHSMHVNPMYACPRCGMMLVKAFLQAPNIGMGHISLEMERVAQKAIKRMDMQKDLKQNYGIEELRMVKNVENKGYEEAYNDIKKNDKMVREHMSATKEIQKAKLKEKQQKRKLSSEEIERRKRILIEKKQKENFESNKINTST